MIGQIVVGRGSERVVIAMVRSRPQQKRVAKALRGHLFPTAEAYQASKLRALAAYQATLG